MKKQLFLILSFYFFLTHPVASQFTPRQWILGQGEGGADVNNTILFTDTGTYVQGLPNTYNIISTTNAAIADDSHPVLFYTNGLRIFNWQHKLIQNGDTLSPCQYTYDYLNFIGFAVYQMSVFIPDPGDTNRFYLFHASGDLFYDNYPGFGGCNVPNKLYYTKIDKTLDNGNGGVVAKNNIIGNDTLGYSLLAVKHGNGRDWWIVARHNHRPRFFTWLVTPTGVAGPFMQIIGPTAYSGFINLKYNYVTNQVVGYRDWHTLDSMYIDIYNFNRCTGIFNSPATLPISYNQFYPGPGGCEISASGQYLYAGTMRELHQYDMLAPNLAASDILIDSMSVIVSGNCPYGAMQLGSDGRIYISSNFGSNIYMNVINSPDSAGLACNAVRFQVVFPANHFQDLPNIPKYEEGPLYGSACDSLSAGIEELQVQPQLIVYPNPSGNVITISYAELENDFTVTVYDRLGKKVITLKNNKAIDVSKLTTGVYVIEVQEKERVVRGKFLKE